AERRWMLTAWAAAALAVLSKGIVVGVLAGAALVIYTLIERDSLTWRRLHLAAGLPLFAGVAAPWFVVVSLRNPAFPGFFFVHEHFARFLTTVHQRVEPWWYFLPLLLVGVLPWVVPLARACGRAALTSGAAAGAAPGCASAPFEPLKFLLVFAAVTLAFFSASGSKLAPYILPILPVLAAVTGASGGAEGPLGARAREGGASLHQGGDAAVQCRPVPGDRIAVPRAYPAAGRLCGRAAFRAGAGAAASCGDAGIRRPLERGRRGRGILRSGNLG